MASISQTLSVALFFTLILFGHPTFSADSPSPSPQLPPENVSPSPATPSPSPALPVSPPAPPKSDPAPNSPSPAPSPGGDDSSVSGHKKSPSPSPSVSGDINHEDQPTAGDLGTKDDSSGGMNGGKKAGVAIGVIAAVCIVGVGALVYKKRQQNIQRSQYGYNAREIL